jgi:hypothetical protein
LEWQWLENSEMWTISEKKSEGYLLEAVPDVDYVV